MKIGIFTFAKKQGMEGTGSSKIRCDWLINYWKDAERFMYGAKYDVIIYQKVYYPKHAKLFKGIKILDLCDPDWLHWGYQTMAMIEEVDAITCSSEELAKSLKNFTDKPVVYIPDRVDLEKFKGNKIHEGDAKTVAWLGYGHNFCMLEPAVGSLIKRGLKLIIVSDRNFLPSAGHSKIDYESVGFEWDTLEEDLKKHNVDFILNPKSQTGSWKYKSENKSYISWAMGYPIAYNEEDIDKFIDAESRNKEVALRNIDLREKYDVKLSVNDFTTLIAKIIEQKGEIKNV